MQGASQAGDAEGFEDTLPALLLPDAQFVGSPEEGAVGDRGDMKGAGWAPVEVSLLAKGIDAAGPSGGGEGLQRVLFHIGCLCFRVVSGRPVSTVG